MWWRRPPLLLLAPLLLAGCGFRPLYGTSSGDPGVADELASIRVAGLPDRAGQLVRNALVTRLSPEGEPERPRYTLQLAVSAQDVAEAISADQTATRDEVIYRVSYNLFSGGTRVDAGQFIRVLSYDYLDQHYSNISAQQDVQARAAEVVADQIRLELAAYFVRGAQARAGS